MKTIKLIIVTLLVSVVSVAMAQKTFKPGDVYGGKTIKAWATEWDLQAFQQTQEIYKGGMTREDFMRIIKTSFPSQAPKSLIDVFVPYYEYIYTFHEKGFTEKQVKGSITGVETAEMLTDLSTWNANNPGMLTDGAKWPWKKILDFLGQILPIAIAIFF